MGTEVAENEVVETAETIEREAEETIEEGSAAVEDEESSAAIEDKEDSTYVEAEISEEAAESNEDDSEDDEEEKEEEDDPERLSELEILPGKTAYINFYYTIDPEIEGMKDQKVDFSFAYTLEDEEGKQTKNTLRETFRYAVDALNLMTVTAGGEKGYVETGKEDEMLLEFDLGLMREVLEEAIEEELEKTENGDASAAEAKRASASELLVGWEDENGERPLGKKDPAVIKNLKCEVETFGVKLDKFKAIPVKDDDNFGTSLKCSFYVSRKTLPGTYYGRVNASYKIKGKSFHTTQGFKVVVKQETGELELVGKIGDSEIVMTGPVSSFPKADELSLKVSEITQEQQEKVDEALQKKAEEEGTEINQYKALDIKLIADGVETEPEGDVQVRFKNVNLEKVDEDKEAEQEKAEEQSIVKKAVKKVMSLFSARDEEENVAAVAETGTEGEEESKDSEDEKSEGNEEAAGENGDTAENSENIKVLHLDEDAVVANEMKSEVQENGDVVMDTDHFSIYIVVNVPDVTSVTVEVHHYADIEYWKLEDTDKNKVEMFWDATSEEWKYYYVDESGNKKAEVPSTTKLRLTEATTKEEKNKLPKELITIGNYNFYDHILYPGAANLTDAEKRYDVKKTEIYSSNTYQFPNGLGTGINYTLAIENWSKVSSAGRYKVKEVKVINTGISDDEKDEELRELKTGKTLTAEEGKDKEVKLAAGTNIIEIYYEPTEGDITGDVAFHDYNVGIEEANGNVRTKRVGINNPILPQKDENDTEEKTNDRIGIGINNNGGGAINDYLIHHISGDDWLFSHKNGEEGRVGENGVVRYGISALDIRTSDGDVEFKVNKDKIKTDPGLFVPNDIKIKETDKDNNFVDYYAKEYIDQYQLKFARNGDNYILTAVCDKQGNEKINNLDRLIYTKDNWKKPNPPMFTNLFWPLDDDSIFKGVPGQTRDHKYGDEQHGIVEENDEVLLIENNFPNTDVKIAHNWFFGMNCELKFKVGDYIGPMNYYFRGDDDFWLYVDGILVKDIDLGGTHKAVPAYVDLRKWLKTEGKEAGISQDPNAEHKMSIFFMERGGTGSCCYMAFTLPNVEVVPVKNPNADSVNVKVHKEWLDEENASNSRPGAIRIQLYQDELDQDGNVVKTREYAQTTLDESNGWSYTWTGFPQYCLVNNDKVEFKYRAKEIKNTMLAKYDDYYDYPSNLETLITNVRKIDIPVEKKWEGDELKNRPNKIKVQLWKKYEDIPEGSNEAPSIIPHNLDEEEVIENEDFNEGDTVEDESIENNSDNPNQETSSTEENFILVDTQSLLPSAGWKYIWKDKPLYEKVNGRWMKVLYTIKELDGDYLKPGWTPESSDGSDGWYTDTYTGNATDGFTITNTFVKSFFGEIPISKECVDFEGTETFKFNIEEGTFTEANGWHPVSDSSMLETEITVNGNAVTDGKAIIEYKISDVSKLKFPIERWYKITEKEEEGNFIYDKTSYIIKMVLKQNDDGSYSANWDPSAIYKDGKPVTFEQLDGKEIRLPFVNYKKTEIQITKKVMGSNSGGNKFDFTATIEKNNELFSTIGFSLVADGTTSISVPVGSIVTIQEKEESHAGYHVSYEITGATSEVLSEDTIKITIPNNATIPLINVTCTNKTGAILPDTGGPGLLMMSRLGWMLLLLALLMAGMEIQFYGERRNRKTASVQREDTRGFDPDDY